MALAGDGRLPQAGSQIDACWFAVSGMRAALLGFLRSAVSFGQQTELLPDDVRALVTRVHWSPGHDYKLEKGQAGSIWAAVDTLEVMTTKNGVQRTRHLRSGQTAYVRSKEELTFRVKSKLDARLVVVQPKAGHSELTLLSFACG